VGRETRRESLSQASGAIRTHDLRFGEPLPSVDSVVNRVTPTDRGGSSLLNNSTSLRVIKYNYASGSVLDK